MLDDRTILILYRSLRAAYFAIEKVARGRGLLRCRFCRERMKTHPPGACRAKRPS